MKRIAVLIESSRSYGRGLIKGISEYAAEQEDWELVYDESAFASDSPHWFDHWQGDGIIARIGNQSLLETIQKKGLPFVDVLNAFDQPSYPSVDCHHQEMAALAFDFFLSCGFSNFGFFGLHGMPFSDRRLAEFSRLAEVAEFPIFSFLHQTPDFNLKTQETNSHATDPDIQSWLAKLPKPIAILCANDFCAMNLSRHCRELDIKIPSEVALLGIDNDPLVCQLQAPYLSSIQPDLNRQGHVAADWLNQRMQGQGEAQGLKLISPRCIIERQSTDVFVSKYPHVMEAQRLIREQLHQGIGTAQVAAAIGVSRSMIDRHFAEEHGHTVKHEITALRLKRVIYLLKHSYKTLETIAAETGIANASALSHFIKTKTGKTPGQIREEHQ